MFCCVSLLAPSESTRLSLLTRKRRVKRNVAFPLVPPLGERLRFRLPRFERFNQERAKGTPKQRKSRHATSGRSKAGAGVVRSGDPAPSEGPPNRVQSPKWKVDPVP